MEQGYPAKEFVRSSSHLIFAQRQFFMTIPPQLGEAARIDGCSELGILWRIYIPLSKPALAAVSIFTFQWSWGDFFFSA